MGDSAAHPSTRISTLLRRACGEEGVSLVEVMFAGFIFAVGLLAMASVTSGSLQSVTAAQARQEATTAVTRVLESARSLPYEQLALRTGEYTNGATVDWDGPDGSAASETYFATSAGSVTNGTYPYFETRDNFTLTTIVTSHPVTRADGVVVVNAARRVTAIAALTSGGEVRQSTVIAEADRGLPQPSFTITPVTAVLVAVPSVSGPQAERCVATQLRNQGANDRYEFVQPTPASQPASSNWSIRVYLDNGTVGTHDGADVLLVDQTGNGAYLPDTATPLVTNATQNLLFCYQRNSYIASENVSFTTRVQSLFDNDVYNNVTHTISVTNQLRLYNFWDLAGDPAPAHGGAFFFTTSAPTRATYIDYDTDGRVGTNVRRGDADAVYTDDDNLTFTASLPVVGNTIGGTVTGSIWAAPREASILGGSGAARTLNLNYSLQVLTSTGTVKATATLTAGTGAYQHGAGVGWQQRDFTFTLPNTVVATGDRIRLAVWCPDYTLPGGWPSKASECHFMYDMAANQASILVPLS